MSWKKALQVEAALAERLEAGTVGVGTEWDNQDQSVCSLGIGMEALGVTAQQWRTFEFDTGSRTVLDPWAVKRACLFGCSLDQADSMSLGIREVMKLNDTWNFREAAERLVSLVKEHVPGDEDPS